MQNGTRLGAIIGHSIKVYHIFREFEQHSCNDFMLILLCTLRIMIQFQHVTLYGWDTLIYISIWHFSATYRFQLFTVNCEAVPATEGIRKNFGKNQRTYDILHIGERQVRCYFTVAWWRGTSGQKLLKHLPIPRVPYLCFVENSSQSPSSSCMRSKCHFTWLMGHRRPETDYRPR